MDLMCSNHSSFNLRIRPDFSSILPYGDFEVTKDDLLHVQWYVGTPTLAAPPKVSVALAQRFVLDALYCGSQYLTNSVHERSEGLRVVVGRVGSGHNDS